MSHLIQAPTPVYARRIRIDAAQVRSVPGRDLQPGDVLTTGIILEVTRNDIDEEVRLEMPGANIHYATYDEHVTVLATLDRAVLDAISLGVFVARAATRRTSTPATREPRATSPSPGPDKPTEPPRPHHRPFNDKATQETTTREGVATTKSNAGPLGIYSDTVEHYNDVCPVHGKTVFARHKTGKSRSGQQRYARRCLACHSDYNLTHRPH